MDGTLTEGMIATIKSAAGKLTGFRRREYQAEVALKSCNGSARKAETVFGWSRVAVNTGLQETETGIRCLDNFRARGCKKTEDTAPELVAEIERIVEPQAPADPKFQTPPAFTRITARAVREELLQNDALRSKVACRQRVGTILNRLGGRLRRVQKTRPEKRSRKPTPSSRTCRPGGPPLDVTPRA